MNNSSMNFIVAVL